MPLLFIYAEYKNNIKKNHSKMFLVHFMFYVYTFPYDSCAHLKKELVQSNQALVRFILALVFTIRTKYDTYN